MVGTQDAGPEPSGARRQQGDPSLDDDQETRLERKLGRQYHLITRDDRLETVAKDIVQHFLGCGFQGKAMVVSIDKATALSVGFGVILNYSSYLRKKDDVVLSGLTASATNALFEVGFGGLITVTAAFVFLGESGATGGTFGLGFNALPVVFAHMGGLGRWIGFVWFFMLFLAAITSSLSMLQPVKAFLQEALGVSARRAVVLLGVMSVCGSLWVLYFSADLVALDTMDFWVGTFAIFVLAAVQIVCFGWVMGVDRGFREAHQGASVRIPHLFRFIIKYVAPVYLGVVFIGFSIQSLPGRLAGLVENPVALATFVFLILVLVLLLVFLRRGEHRWREAGMDLDGILGQEEAR